MPTLIAPVVADWTGTASPTSQPVTNGLSFVNSSYGAAYDSKTGLQSQPTQWILYGELEIPTGATITGVRLSIEARTRTGTQVK